MRRRVGMTAMALIGLASCTDARAPAVGASDAGLQGDARSDAGATASPSPPPISGGTLLATRDGETLVAADPDADRVFVVSIQGDALPTVRAVVSLPPGEEPGRLAEDGAGRVHVVLRRGGAIATLDVTNGALLARRVTCPEPRGIAYDAAIDRLHVACASGDLVSLDPASGKVTRRVHLDVDLRDVVVVPGGLVVSRFKTAELLRLDGDGNVVQRAAPASIERGSLALALPHDTMTPGVAWRTFSTSDGRVFMLHQYGVTRALEIGESAPDAPSPPPAYAAPAGIRCGGIVEQAVSELRQDGTFDMGVPLPVRSLTVDAAASSSGETIAIVHPGARAGDPTSTLYTPDALLAHGRSPVLCATAQAVSNTAQAVAVVALQERSQPSGATSRGFAVQTRAPAALLFFDSQLSALAGSLYSLSLPDAPRYADMMFHLDAGRGIACAQCHPEGGEDGRVWNFSPSGPRRTQSLRVGLSGTEPFHWSGNLPGFAELIGEVFVRRMGGAPPPNTVADALQTWLFALPPPTPIRRADAPEVQRGRALFESPDVGCTRCHDGAKVATSSNQDVGVDSPNVFQTPALRGVGYRAPFLHDGCAKTLRDRFDSACGGGDEHGKTSGLSSAELDDLVAYLESL